MARGRQHTLRGCLDAELALTRTIARTPDFLECVRAALVDKDRSPTWQRGSRGRLTLPT
ncbi:enoyl-CoA hydratase/isomerase family protein [Streptomyces sp. NPDC047061]|uniref:enoyl-CoA hydratase/isomerase family protein n=1 Tax=Streptomyces sp. NPDC047061 TaxID=3154605 RepID=UPI0033F97A81